MSGRPQRPRPTRVHRGSVIRLLVTAALIVLLARVVDLPVVGRALLNAEPAFLLCAIAAAMADRVVMILKWYPLLRLQVASISLGRAARAYLAAGFAGVFLPVSIGADLLRAAVLGRGERVMVEVGASIVVERLLGVFGLAAVAALALVGASYTADPLRATLPYLLGASTLAATAVVLPLSGRGRSVYGRIIPEWARSRHGNLVRRLAAACALYRGRERTLVWIGLLSVLEQGFPILVLWLAGRALGTPIPLSALAVVVPLSLFIARIPISFSGIGVAEGSLVYLLGLYGIAPTEALAVAVTSRAAGLAALLPGAFCWTDLATRSGPAPGAAAIARGGIRP